MELIKTTNKHEWAIPVKITPIIKATNIGDGSDRYGGADDLASWKMTASLEYEIEIPTFLTIETDYLVERIDMNIEVGSIFTKNGYKVPEKKFITRTQWDLNLPDGIHIDATNITLPTDATVFDDFHLDYETRLVHYITESDLEEIEIEVTVNLPVGDTGLDFRQILINTSSGRLNFGDNWTLRENGSKLILFPRTTTLSSTDIIEIYIYKDNAKQLLRNIPIITSTPVNDVTAGQLYEYYATYEDPDPMEDIAWSFVRSPVGMNVHRLGHITWSTVGVTPGKYVFTLRITDTDGFYSDQTTVVTVH